MRRRSRCPTWSRKSVGPPVFGACSSPVVAHACTVGTRSGGVIGVGVTGGNPFPILSIGQMLSFLKNVFNPAELDIRDGRDADNGAHKNGAGHSNTNSN